MKALFGRARTRHPGWMAIAMQPGELRFAHAIGGPQGRCTITRFGSQAMPDGERDLQRLAKDLDLQRYQCLTLLPPADYQLLVVEAPNVPPAELKLAVRWKVKDMLDYHVEDATIDVLDIPPDASASARPHSMYAVSARNDVIQACIQRFDAARIPLTVIDILETAQRNIGALLEPQGRGLALLYVGAAQSLLTITLRGELYLARRIDAGLDQLESPQAETREGALNRMLLEVQRSFDHLDRQFPFVSVAKVVLAPQPRPTLLGEHLRANLDVPVEALNLRDLVGLPADTPLDADAAWRLFHVIGAALRHETKGL